MAIRKSVYAKMGMNILKPYFIEKNCWATEIEADPLELFKQIQDFQSMATIYFYPQNFPSALSLNPDSTPRSKRFQRKNRRKSSNQSIDKISPTLSSTKTFLKRIEDGVKNAKIFVG